MWVVATDNAGYQARLTVSTQYTEGSVRPSPWYLQPSLSTVASLGFFQVFPLPGLQVPYCFLNSSPYETTMFTAFVLLTPYVSVQILVL